ncbi:MAG: chromosomal replication initiator protein DnaA [Muribaculaceae bacterium]|nr:chromosomal replication initiator protein DnaA [Muribaculaceae bacterium]
MKEDYKSKWSKCIGIITDNIGEQKAKTWFGVARPIRFVDKKLTLQIPSRFFYEKYEDEFYGILSSSLRKVFGEDVLLEYEIEIVGRDKDSKVRIAGTKQSPAIKNKYLRSMQSVSPVPDESDTKSPDFDPQLNESLTFENYCVGASNKLPYTIAEYIANNPWKNNFNPFFLYGDVGVGKTHLIQAIGIRVKEGHPRAKVSFVTLRQFQQLYQHATIKKEVPHFINWFQQMDVLLIDDLQELSHKEGTTDAMFAIFNHLHQNGKALIFTCDRPPVELDGLADRLIDRFKWGITEQLQTPDYELRKKILEFKASKNGLELTQPVIELIAEQSTGSIRELEGIVMGILTRSITLNCPITLELAQAVMKHTVRPKAKKQINFEMIVEATAEFYKINPDSIFSKSRQREIADARQVIMYLSNKLTNLSSPVIGQKLNRAHTTVLHGISAVEDRLTYAKDLREALSAIENDLKS